ncbi:MAG: transglutaminase family protein [Pseudomonadota bacterium]
MMLDVRHRTHYRYANSAVFSQHLLRLTPTVTPGQRVIMTDVKIDPEPDGIDTHRDMFGNVVHVATVSHPHEDLEIIATSRVERADRNALIFDTSAAWEKTRAAALGINGVSPVIEVSPYAFPSAMTVADAEIEAYARDSFTANRPVLDAAQNLMRRINEDFEYTPGVTQFDTLPTESFRARKGVCQDFAHVMLAAMRSLRIPARYVSGYLRTTPPPGRARLKGADASHAWVSVWDPAFEWIDFDPTNNCVPGDDHVTLGQGRDYTDISPVSGIVVGAGRQVLSVGVDVTDAV